MRCKIVTSNKRGGIRYLPYAFTEQGVAMLSGVLNSDKAIQVNISIMRTFLLIRNFALTNNELKIQLKELERKYDKQFVDVFEAINYLIKKDNINKQHNTRVKIGFKTKE